ncbi:DUF1284 domain-containing protein [Paracoccus sp. p4-l81]|uniref:DUF1284 domain-containing protein n=1 Tax=unclassified Paracoccus (in: a-proteobacteria) TaxID=2688777 RepID=UPI0035B91B5D
MTDHPIPLRPHHVLCLIGWQGRGYAPGFTANMNRLSRALRVAPDRPLRVTGRADAICAPCPHRIGTGCAAGDRITDLDARHADALDLRAGQILTWDQALARALRLEPDDLDRICAGCQWLDLGLCKAALSALKAGRAAPAP